MTAVQSDGKVEHLSQVTTAQSSEKIFKKCMIMAEAVWWKCQMANELALSIVLILKANLSSSEL